MTKKTMMMITVKFNFFLFDFLSFKKFKNFLNFTKPFKKEVINRFSLADLSLKKFIRKVERKVEFFFKVTLLKRHFNRKQSNLSIMSLSKDR